MTDPREETINPLGKFVTLISQSLIYVKGKKAIGKLSKSILANCKTMAY